MIFKPPSEPETAGVGDYTRTDCRCYDGRGAGESLFRDGCLRKNVHPMTATPKVFRTDIGWRWRDGVTGIITAQNDLVGQHRRVIVERRDLDALHGVIG